MSAKKIKMTIIGVASVLGIGVIPVHGSTLQGDRLQIAFLHTLLHDHSAHHDSSHKSHHGHHGKGCFITTTPQNHARGVRHWVSPCPHRELRHMNPYHLPHHKMRYNPHTQSHHRVDN